MSPLTCDICYFMFSFFSSATPSLCPSAAPESLKMSLARPPHSKQADYFTPNGGVLVPFTVVSTVGARAWVTLREASGVWGATRVSLREEKPAFSFLRHTGGVRCLQKKRPRAPRIFFYRRPPPCAPRFQCWFERTGARRGSCRGERR